jgi:AraC-like DNA-binding protein
MNWFRDIQGAINYIENNLFKNIGVEDVAKHLNYSTSHFQKMFLVGIGLSISEYLKNRRLSVAGQELKNSKSKVIDVALKYGYETSESFTRAFARFHGFNPSKIHSSENRLKYFNPLTIQINIQGGFIMSENLISNVEKIVKTIEYKGVIFEVVERPDVIWVGCVDYATNNGDEPNIDKTLKRYREELIEVPKQDLINPGWSASISINYSCDDKPSGIMFAQETYSNEQDERYDLVTQSGGLWLRTGSNEESDNALLGRGSMGLWEYFGILESVAEENGYAQNPDVHMQIEYHCHAEYDTPPHTSFAYIPIVAEQFTPRSNADYA